MESSREYLLEIDKSSTEEQMSLLWGDWGVSSQVEELKSVLLRRPGAEIDNFDFSKNTALFSEAVDPERFRAQHDSLAEIYKSNGVKVYYLEEQREDCPNAVFMRDLLFMTPEGAIITRPASGLRRPEVVAVAKRLGELNIPILRTISGTATFEGADCFWLDRNSVIIATSVRTNEEGFKQVEYEMRRMGVDDIIHSPSPAEAGHIDGMLNIVDRKKAIFNPVQLPYGTWRAMVDRGYEMIAVPLDEALNNASTNTVALRPGVVIHPSGNPRTTQIMREHGIEVINIEFDEIFKGNGAVHCCTATLKRGN